MPRKQVIILAIANSETQDLPSLDEEADEIQKLFQEVEEETGIHTVLYPRFSMEQFLLSVSDVKWEAQIFHFAGHSDGSTLQLSDIDVAFGNLGGILHKDLRSRLVFLNGCGTHDLAEELLSAGIPAVIATSSNVEDQKANLFAKYFYKSFVSGDTLGEAFEEAKVLLKAHLGEDCPDINLRFSTRHLSTSPDSKLPEASWELLLHPYKKRILKWKLASHSKRRVNRNRLKLGIILLLSIGMVAALVIPQFRMSIDQDFYITDINGAQPNENFPKRVELVIDVDGSKSSHPVKGWYTPNIPIRGWNGDPVKAYLQIDGVPCSNPEFELSLDDSENLAQADTLRVNPIYGEILMNDQRDAPLGSLRIEAFYVNLFQNTFIVDGPNYYLSSFLPFYFGTVGAQYLEIRMLDEGLSMGFRCIFVPARLGVESTSFKCKCIATKAN